MRSCRKLLSLAAAVVVAVMCTAWWQTLLPTLAAGSQPNIIFILTDDQRLEDIDHMPILQRLLVGKGMLFENYFSSVSLCCPSRTSILRGQYAHNTGVRTNNPPNGGFETANELGIESSTIAVWLHDRGYKTALIGKYLNGYPGSLGASYIPPGWDYWASASSGNPYSEYNYVLNENGKQVRYGSAPEDYGTDVYTGKAVEFIKGCSSQKKPFFVYLAFYAPHAPATPAPRHIGLFQGAQIPRTKAFNEANVSGKPQFIQNLQPMTNQEIQAADVYYGKRLRSLQAVDNAIGTICETLKDTKQMDNTYIVFASDNGYHLGEHRLRRGKMTAYETDIHLPLIVRGPGVQPGVKVSELVGNIDLAPSFADIAGAKTPEFVDGRSIVPILKGQNLNELTWRKAFLVEHWRARGPAGGQGRRRLSEANCEHSPACATHCNHMADCYCCNTDQDISQADDDSSRVCSSQCKSDLLPVSYEEQMELAHDMEAERQLAQRQNSAQGAGWSRRRAGGPLGEREFGPIPEFHALRTAGTTYVEYETGEREYYRLTEDQDEVNNLLNKTPADKIQSASRQVQELSAGASSKERQLENHPGIH